MIDVKPFKNSIGDISLSSSQRTNSTTSSRNGLSSVFVDYSEKCSLVGVPYIRHAKSLCERAVWSILLLAAICVMGYHLQMLPQFKPQKLLKVTWFESKKLMLFASYFSYSKHTQISLGFNTLDFPAITFCNVNAMRKSKMENATEGLLAVIQAVSMDNMQKNVKKWSPEYDKQQNRPSNAPPGNMRENNFFDSMPNNNISSPRANVSGFYKQNYPDTWQGECQASTFNSLKDTFKDYWVELQPELRLKMGHQIQNMLIQCSYAGGQCVMSNFTVSQSASYGNCYTIQNNKWLARSSGPDQGFELILFLETDEYIPGITNEKGIQLVIHEQGTTAFPDDEGIAVAAGAQTVIGLRQANISRLGNPYGECASTDEFNKTYGVKYTRTTCQKICMQKSIIAACKCFDQRAVQTSAIMNDTAGYPPCENQTQMYCMTEVQWNFTTDNDKCACNSPCQ